MEYIQIKKTKELDNLRPLFADIRFYMGRSVLDGKMGEAYTDFVERPSFAYLLVRRYCFISGDVLDDDLKNLIKTKLKSYLIIPSDKIKLQIQQLFGDRVKRTQRYSMCKNPNFKQEDLNKFTKSLDGALKIKKIDFDITTRIRRLNFITISDDYDKNGIGFCAFNNDDIVGVATSNIIYNDGIEVNIKVAEDYRRKGIATALASRLILECLQINKNVSWDAKTIISVKLAEKLGFKYHSSYDVFELI